MTLQHTEVAVIGGGMVGGALALGLAQQGFDVTVIEQAAPRHSIPPANRTCAFPPSARRPSICCAAGRLGGGAGDARTPIAVLKPGVGKCPRVV